MPRLRLSGTIPQHLLLCLHSMYDGLHRCMISGFHHSLNEILALLGCYAVRLVLSCGRFGTPYVLELLDPCRWDDRLSQNVGNYLPIYAVYCPRRENMFPDFSFVSHITFVMLYFYSENSNGEMFIRKVCYSHS
jgi:hypothetical protein